MRVLHFIAGLALACAGPAVGQIARSPEGGNWRPLPLHVGGRVVVHPHGDGGADYVHQWPGIYWEGAFSGDRFALAFNDLRGEYRVLVDALPPVTFAQPGKKRVEIVAIGTGTHRVRVEKVNEDSEQTGEFDGILVPKNTAPAQMPARTRQIEYVGDSSMTGFGARSPSRDCPGDLPRLTSDTQNAYPALVAKHYDADYQINAISGRGLTRNYANIFPDATVPVFYPYTLLDKSVAYADTAWQPQIIVIKLNADFVGQPAMDQSTLRAFFERYINAYADFVRELHARDPGAAILIWWWDVPEGATNNPFAAARTFLRARAAAAGVRTIDFLPIRTLGGDRMACSGHPSLSDHRKIAAWLEQYLDAHPALWGSAAPAAQ